MRIFVERSMWLFRRESPTWFSASSTAEEVTEGIDGSDLTAIVADQIIYHLSFFFLIILRKNN